MELIIAITVGLILGAIIGAYIMKLRSNSDSQTAQELAAAQEKITELTQLRDIAQTKADELTASQQQAQTDLAVLTEKYTTAATALGQKEQQLKESQASTEELRQKHEEAIAKNAETTAQLQASNSTLASVRNDLGEAREQKQQLESRFSTLRDDNEKAAADKSRLQAELQAVTESLEQERRNHSGLRAKYETLSASESDLKKSLATAEEKIATFDKIDAELKNLRQLNSELTATRSELQTRLDEQAEQTQQKLQLLEESKVQLKEQFKNLAQEIFEEKSTKFTEVNKEKLETLINPFKEQIKGFAETIKQNHENDFRHRTELKQEIQNLHKLNATMSTEANNLTRALKGDTKTQGNWGEVILERILEVAGLRQGYEFDREVSTNDADGNRYRPDVIIHLPEKKDVIIDSKVSLTAYDSYTNAVTEEERKKAMDAHLRSVTSHIDTLSKKNYESLEGINNLDYVLLFMPIEGAFRLAVEADPELILKASKKNIMLITPSTLMISLRTVHSLWQYEYQNQNARDIADRAASLCDKFTNFVADVEDIGKHIDKLQTSFGKARTKLSSGSGNLIRQCEMLKKLGVKPKKQIPERLVTEAFADDSKEIEDRTPLLTEAEA